MGGWYIYKLGDGDETKDDWQGRVLQLRGREEDAGLGVGWRGVAWGGIWDK